MERIRFTAAAATNSTMAAMTHSGCGAGILSTHFFPHAGQKRRREPETLLTKC